MYKATTTASKTPTSKLIGSNSKVRILVVRGQTNGRIRSVAKSVIYVGFILIVGS